MHVRTESLALSSGLPQLVTSGQNGSMGLGAASGIGNRFYSDGFVKTDSLTSITGQTVDFGYAQSSQVGNDTLAFHGVTDSYLDVSTITSLTPDAVSSVLAQGGMLGLTYEIPLLRSPASLGLDFSVAVVGAAETLQHQSFRAVQTVDTLRDRVTDTYGTNGVLLPPGPFQGSPGNLGPAIEAEPHRAKQTERIARDRVVFFDRVTDALEMTLTTLSIGPTIRWKERFWSFDGGLGFALNVASWRAESEQTLLTSVNRSKAQVLASRQTTDSGIDVLPGFYVQAGLTRQFSAHWSSALTLRYDWSRTLRAEAGRSHFDLEMNGLSMVAQLIYRF